MWAVVGFAIGVVFTAYWSKVARQPVGYWRDVDQVHRDMARDVEDLFRDHDRALELYAGPVWRVEADSDREAIETLLRNQ